MMIQTLVMAIVQTLTKSIGTLGREEEAWTKKEHCMDGGMWALDRRGDYWMERRDDVVG